MPTLSPQEGEPTYDPVVHRIFLLQELQECFVENLAKTAFVLDENLEHAEILSGVVAPLKNVDGEYYTDTRVTLVLCRSGLMSFLTTRNKSTMERTDYRLNLTETDKESLSPADGKNDSHNRFLLKRTTFHRLLGEEILEYLDREAEQ